MKLKVPGAILPLGCAILSTRAKTVRRTRVNEINKLKKFFAKPSFNAFKKFNENLVVVHMHKDTLKLNRPIYVAMSILDLSKNLMFDFYYNQLKKQYSCCNLLYTDTDSFILRIETDDVYKDIKDN